MSRLAAEVQGLTQASIELARSIDHATTGDRLGRVMHETMDRNMGPYNRLRQVVHARLDELGGVGEEIGLFMLAADMATTAECAEGLTLTDKRMLRRLWNDLRAR